MSTPDNAQIRERTVFYVGRDKRGNAHGGRFATDDLTAFIEAKFKAGWQQLVINESAEPGAYGERLGAIERDAFTGTRTWWVWSEALGART